MIEPFCKTCLERLIKDAFIGQENTPITEDPSDTSTARCSWDKEKRNFSVVDRLECYSSDFVVFRELIQNSDDAEATSFEVHLHYQSSHRHDLYEPLIKPIVCSHPRQSLLKGFIGQFLPQPRKSSSTVKEEDEFDHSLIDEIRCVNNGKVFDQSDWKRSPKEIRMSNLSDNSASDSSVFSYLEKPLIESGRSRLAFVWKNGRSLSTFRQELNDEDCPNELTSIILPMKDKSLLQTKDVPSSNNDEVEERKKRSTSRNTRTNEIVPTLNLCRLKRYLTKVLSFTKSLRLISIDFNGRLFFSLNKRIEEIRSSRLVSSRLN
jgi:hypothetical protein